jgi:hypothetical protein
LQQHALYFYNAACYHAQLGEHDEALRMLQQAFTMDAALKKTARRDPDLAPLKEKL